MTSEALRSAALLTLALLALAGCGEAAAPKPPPKNARNAVIQVKVEAAIKKEVVALAEELGNYVAPELTTVDCIPETDSKLSCLVEGYISLGPDSGADVNQRWEAIVDGATGRYQVRLLDG